MLTASPELWLSDRGDNGIMFTLATPLGLILTKK